MSTLPLATREALRTVLADHFVMWHELDGAGPPGEWRCACGLKFGFSDSAIAHQADMLAALTTPSAYLAPVVALASEWRADLDRGGIRDPDARYCWETAHRELTTALAAALATPTTEDQ